MRKPTKIHHPVLKQEATVDERAVAIWEDSGWKPGPLPEGGAGETPTPDDKTPDDGPGTDDAPPARDAEPVESQAARTRKPKTSAATPATTDA